jgi:hypothetical protein
MTYTKRNTMEHWAWSKADMQRKATHEESVRRSYMAVEARKILQKSTKWISDPEYRTDDWAAELADRLARTGAFSVIEAREALDDIMWEDKR